VTEQDFAYWLQGYFELYIEIENKLPPINDRIKICIKKHIKLVNEYASGKPPSAFCARILGMIEAGDGERLAKAMAAAIKEKFEHEIDPSYSNTQALNQIHNLGSDVVIRC
jgi:hypothetical protein